MQLRGPAANGIHANGDLVVLALVALSASNRRGSKRSGSGHTWLCKMMMMMQTKEGKEKGKSHKSSSVPWKLNEINSNYPTVNECRTPMAARWALFLVAAILSIACGGINFVLHELGTHSFEILEVFKAGFAWIHGHGIIPPGCDEERISEWLRVCRCRKQRRRSRWGIEDLG